MNLTSLECVTLSLIPQRVHNNAVSFATLACSCHVQALLLPPGCALPDEIWRIQCMLHALSAPELVQANFRGICAALKPLQLHPAILARHMADIHLRSHCDLDLQQLLGLPICGGRSPLC